MSAKKTQEVAVVEQKKRSLQRKTPQAVAVPVTIEQIMFEAVQQKDVSILRELLAFQRELDAMDAEKAFNVAMAAFRAECPIVQKKTEGAQNQAKTETLWKYADLADIEISIKPHLAKNGLSYTWDSKDITRDGKPGKETICWISHIMGHKSSGTFTSSIDAGTSAMNAIQKEGSTVEYGRRWSLKLALGIVVAGEDDDAVSAVDPAKQAAAKKNGVISPGEVKKIETEIGSGDEVLYRKVTKGFKIETLDELKKVDFKDCLQRVKEYKQAKAILKKDGSKS